MSEELKALLGDSYQEGMTLEQVGEFFKGKKFADLSSGKYVDKSKFDNEVTKLTNSLNEKDSELKAKLTEEEKSALAQKEKDDEIAKLKQLLSDNTISGNKNTAIGLLQGSRDILGIESTNNEFTTFIENITTEDGAKTNDIANYVAKLVKDSYEKGKKDATRDSMGAFGKTKGEAITNDKTGNEFETLGKRLANDLHKSKENNYFK